MELFSEFESCYYEAFTKMLCKPPMTEKEAREFIKEKGSIETIGKSDDRNNYEM